MFCRVIPYLNRHETLHEVAPEESVELHRFLGGIFSKAKRWPDYALRFIASYVMKGAAFILLVGVFALLGTDKGWLSVHDPYSLVMARAGDIPNGAHLLTYFPLVALGVYTAWKFREDILLDCYQGLLVVAEGVSIHEIIWTAQYYLFYWEYLSWEVLANVVKDVFFFMMLGIFLYVYAKYPFQKIPLKKFAVPTAVYTAYEILWGLDGFRISTINNFVYGQGQWMITQWWADPLTNLWEIGSWTVLTVGMAVVVWRAKASR